MRSCNDIMTQDPTCCAAGDPVSEAVEVMKNEDVGVVPVVDDAVSKKIVGIITDRDVVLNIVAAGLDAKTALLQDVMTRNPVTVRPDDPIQTALDAMSQHQIRRIPVVDGKNRVVGIIAQADIANRMDIPEKFEKVVENISQPV